MNCFQPTSKLIVGEEYLSSAQDFFGSFAPAFDCVRSQICKIETLQEYSDDKDESFRQFSQGNIEEAVRLIKESVSSDEEDYLHLKQNLIEFVRCRIVETPENTYTRWEYEHYKKSIGLGERIFICNQDTLKNFTERFLQNDFMIFDTRFAFVHNYDATGALLGGWRIENVEKIAYLLASFAFVKANSINFLSLENLES